MSSDFKNMWSSISAESVSVHIQFDESHPFYSSVKVMFSMTPPSLGYVYLFLYVCT